MHARYAAGRSPLAALAAAVALSGCAAPEPIVRSVLVPCPPGLPALDYAACPPVPAPLLVLDPASGALDLDAMTLLGVTIADVVQRAVDARAGWQVCRAQREALMEAIHGCPVETGP